MGTAYNTGKIVTDGLALYLDAANPRSYPGSGTTWTDLSGRRNNGTLNNFPILDSSFKGSFNFDGSNDFISFVDSGLISTSGIAVSCWIRTTIVDKWIFDKSQGSYTNNVGYSLSCGSAGIAVFYVNNIGVSTTASVCTGAWLMITGVWTPSVSLKIYINGIEDGNTSVAVPASINDPSYNLQIARRSTSSPRDYFNGRISNVQIYNRALSTAEIKTNFNALRGRYGI